MVPSREAPLACLARLGREPQMELRAGALAFARLHGDEGGLDRLDQMAAALDPEGGVEQLTHTLGRWRIDEDGCAQLPEVLASGAGSATNLALIWLETARLLGWTAEMLPFPGLALVRLTDGKGVRVVVDPAGGGEALDAPSLRALLKAAAGPAAELRPFLFSGLSNRAILIRQQDELKKRALLDGRIDAAIAVVEGILAFAPEQAPLWREAGMMLLRLDHKADAIAALEQFVARTGNTAARRRTQQLLHDLRARLP